MVTIGTASVRPGRMRDQVVRAAQLLPQIAPEAFHHGRRLGLLDLDQHLLLHRGLSHPWRHPVRSSSVSEPLSAASDGARPGLPSDFVSTATTSGCRCGSVCASTARLPSCACPEGLHRALQAMTGWTGGSPPVRSCTNSGTDAIAVLFDDTGDSRPSAALEALQHLVCSELWPAPHQSRAKPDDGETPPIPKSSFYPSPPDQIPGYSTSPSSPLLATSTPTAQHVVIMRQPYRTPVSEPLWPSSHCRSLCTLPYVLTLKKTTLTSPHSPP